MFKRKKKKKIIYLFHSLSVKDDDYVMCICMRNKHKKEMMCAMLKSPIHNRIYLLYSKVFLFPLCITLYYLGSL